LTQCVGINEVREDFFAVDQDDRKALAVPSLELGIIGDVDFLELEGNLRAYVREHAPRALAEMAFRREVEPNATDRAHA
jgi:hypothetical protein